MAIQEGHAVKDDKKVVRNRTPVFRTLTHTSSMPQPVFVPTYIK